MIFLELPPDALLQCVQAFVLGGLEAVLAGVLVGSEGEDFVIGLVLVEGEGKNLAATVRELADLFGHDAVLLFLGLGFVPVLLLDLGVFLVAEKLRVILLAVLAANLAILILGDGHQEGEQRAGQRAINAIGLLTMDLVLHDLDAETINLRPEADEGFLHYLLLAVTVEEDFVEPIHNVATALGIEPFLHLTVTSLQAQNDFLVGVRPTLCA